MSVQEIANILNSFSRLLDFMNCHGHDETIQNIEVDGTILIITLQGHQGEVYDLEVWNSYTTGELCVENPINHVSMFDFAEEYDMTENDVKYIRTGIR